MKSYNYLAYCDTASSGSKGDWFLHPRGPPPVPVGPEQTFDTGAGGAYHTAVTTRSVKSSHSNTDSLSSVRSKPGLGAEYLFNEGAATATTTPTDQYEDEHSQQRAGPEHDHHAISRWSQDSWPASPFGSSISSSLFRKRLKYRHHRRRSSNVEGTTLSHLALNIINTTNAVFAAQMRHAHMHDAHVQPQPQPQTNKSTPEYIPRSIDSMYHAITCYDDNDYGYGYSYGYGYGYDYDYDYDYNYNYNYNHDHPISPTLPHRSSARNQRR